LCIMASYKELKVWQKGIHLVKDIYKVTDAFPKGEHFGLVDQLRRASISIPSNIAEGNGRHSRGDYIHYLHIARGSCYEMETQVIISKELGFLDEAQYQSLSTQIDEVGRMLNAMIQKLSSTSNN
jgi:S23 ribosomal protein.